MTSKKDLKDFQEKHKKQLEELEQEIKQWRALSRGQWVIPESPIYPVRVKKTKLYKLVSE